MAPHPFSVLSICAGVGGLDLGLRIAVTGTRTVLFVERESYAAACLMARMEDAALEPAPVWDDLCAFDGKPWRGRVHCIAAGLPCQPYSVAGKQLGHEDERAIWPEFIRVVGEVQPWMVFIENVPEFLRYFRPVGDELSRLGYVVEEPLFVSAAECGGSHERERVFILGHRERGGDSMAHPNGIERRNGGDSASGGDYAIGTDGNIGSEERDSRNSITLGCGEPLAFTPRGGFGTVRQPSERDGLAGRGDAQLEHPQGERRPADAMLRRMGGGRR